MNSEFQVRLLFLVKPALCSKVVFICQIQCSLPINHGEVWKVLPVAFHRKDEELRASRNSNESIEGVEFFR